MKKLLLLLLFLPLFSWAQVIVTAAGTGTAGYAGDGHPAVDAELNEPYRVALDDSGNLYICDVGNLRIRKISNPANLGVGIVTTIAGNGGSGYGGDHGPGIYAEVSGIDVAIDNHGNVYIADADNNRIRKVTSTDIITTIAGTGIAGYNGDTILATTAQLNSPQGIAVDSIGNIYIADAYNYRIRKIDTAGIISTIAGTGISGYSGDNGMADTAEIHHPISIKIDITGNIYFSDSLRIRKIDIAGIITTVAGNGLSGCIGDSGLATLAEIEPDAIALDSAGNLFIADGSCNRVRKINTSGIINTIAGGGTGSSIGDEGNPLLALLDMPSGVVVSNSGDIYIGDVGHSRVRLVTTHLVGVSELYNNEIDINIYPNPVNDEVYIETSCKGNYTITITDVIGKLIYIDSFTEKKSIPLANWQVGVYYVQVTSENGYKVIKKLVVQ